MKIQSLEKYVPPIYRRDVSKLDILSEKLAEYEYEMLGKPRLTSNFLVDFQKLIADKVKLISDNNAVDEVLRKLDVTV